MSVAYPSAPVASPVARARPPSAGSAETMVLIALVLQVIGGVVLLVGFAWLLGFSILFPYPYAWAAVAATASVSGVVVVFLYFAYTYSYARIRHGAYEAAETPTLVLGILSLFAGILPGIFYLIGYVKLGDAIREQQGLFSGLPAPAASAVQQLACRGCGRVYYLGQYGFCPACGQRLGP